MTKLAKPIAISIAFFFLYACTGRQPNLVMVNQYGDDQKSCKTLESEMENVRDELHSSLHKRNKLVPSSSMDFRNAKVQEQEYEAYRERYNHLASIAKAKKCRLSTKECPATKKLQENSKDQH